MQRVHFFSHDRNINLKDRKKLKNFIEDLFAKEKTELGNVSYIFCSDKYLLEINNRFLKHDFYTDVITFDLSSPEMGISGEVYISIDRVKDNAKQIKTPFLEELHRVIFHGALHLCGYRDKKKMEIEEMRLMETKYLKKYL